jgi:hypothetical protein
MCLSPKGDKGGKSLEGVVRNEIEMGKKVTHRMMSKNFFEEKCVIQFVVHFAL